MKDFLSAIAVILGLVVILKAQGCGGCQFRPFKQHREQFQENWQEHREQMQDNRKKRQERWREFREQNQKRRDGRRSN